MKLSELHAKLGELIDQGYGDRRVIDDFGNDVAEVHGPATDQPADPDQDAVMLGCYVDRSES